MLGVAAFTLGCGRGAPITTVRALPPLPALRFASDQMRVDTVAPGIKHWQFWINKGPWAINVLDVDRGACWTPVALKAGGRAIGREKTSVLIRAYADSMRQRGVLVAGGVNADFFSFAPPGVPVGAHVHDGQVFTGPVERPVVAVRADGSVILGALTEIVDVRHGARRTSARWNHPLPAQLSVVDRLYGEKTDTATGALEILLREAPAVSLSPPPGQREPTQRRAGIVIAIDTTRDGVPVPPNGFLISLGARADSGRRDFASTLRVGDTVSIARRFENVVPVEAVGGHPMLIRGDSILDDVNTVGNAGFRGRNPRTAVGLAANGRRLFLVTVDGRQQGYSDGMSLAELAALLRDLGASDAINLDGGGSTTFVVPDSTGALIIANRPSDREGERPVANALAIERVCGDLLR